LLENGQSQGSMKISDTVYIKGLCFFNTGFLYYSVKSKQIITVKEAVMSNLTRWEPTREMITLREAMDRLFDDAFTRPFSLLREGGWSGVSAPAIDMYQTDNEVVVKATLPGFKADQVQINLTGDVLTLKGEAKQEDERNERAWHIREHRFGTFERSVALPTAVKTDKVEAVFENGILTVTLPKADEVKPKTINIRTK
jgi:HSP20 family protein